MLEATNGLLWLPEMDARIVSAVQEARIAANQLSADDIPAGSNPILTLSFRKVMWSFKRLRTKVSMDDFVRHIGFLNVGKQETDSDYIDTRWPGPSGEGDQSELPQVKSRTNTPAHLQLTAAVSGLASNQQECNETNKLLLEQLIGLQSTLDTQNSFFLEFCSKLSELTEAIKSMPAVSPQVQPKSVPKEPQLLARRSTMEIRRDQICYGSEWQKIISRSLTNSEYNWQQLYPFKVQQWKANRTFLTDVPTIIIFGWFPTLRVCQEIFYRLTPEKLYWICPLESQKEAYKLATKVDPQNGQLAIVIANGAQGTSSDRAKELCKSHRMGWYKTDRRDIMCDAVATHWITHTYMHDMEFVHHQQKRDQSNKDAD